VVAAVCVSGVAVSVGTHYGTADPAHAALALGLAWTVVVTGVAVAAVWPCKGPPPSPALPAPANLASFETVVGDVAMAVQQREWSRVDVTVQDLVDAVATSRDLPTRVVSGNTGALHARAQDILATTELGTVVRAAARAVAFQSPGAAVQYAAPDGGVRLWTHAAQAVDRFVVAAAGCGVTGCVRVRGDVNVASGAAVVHVDVIAMGTIDNNDDATAWLDASPTTPHFSTTTASGHSPVDTPAPSVATAVAVVRDGLVRHTITVQLPRCVRVGALALHEPAVPNVPCVHAPTAGAFAALLPLRHGDVVCTGLWLPDGDGRDVCTAARAAGFNGPVVAVVTPETYAPVDVAAFTAVHVTTLAP
jgi:hypothetical protein